MKLKKTIRCTAVAAALIFGNHAAHAQFDLGGLLNQAGQALNTMTATDNFAVESLVGSWAYVSPSIQFDSSNALQKLGGVAAGTAVESKLAPYYNKLGVNKLTLTVDKDLNFTMSVGKAKLTGTLTKDGSKLNFNFNAFNKISIGKVAALATKSGSQVNLSFDAKRLIAIAKTIGSLSGNSSLQSIVSLLSQYDGIYVGARLKRTN